MSRPKEFNMNRNLMEELDFEQIASQVKEGDSSGHLNNGEGKNIYWELNFNVWEDEL